MAVTFLQTMSHELRTPLNAVIGFAEIIAGDVLGAGLNATYRGYGADIVDSARHLLETLEDILDISRIEAGSYRVDLIPLDPVPVAREVVARLASKAAESGVSLAPVAGEAGTVPACADERALHQLLAHLVGNAVRFTGKGGTVRVTVADDGPGPVVTVADDGPGIPEEEQERAFAPFVQVERNREGRHQEGSGLGLPIARRLAGLMGGRLRLESTPGQGTTVTLHLPRG